jgi:hypothetical protein
MPRVGRCVASSRRDRRQIQADHLVDTPPQGKYSLEVCLRVRYPRYRFSCILTILFKNELHLRTNAALEALHLDKRV